LAEYRTGDLKPMSAEEVIAELNRYLESDSVGFLFKAEL
jgi:hypothetical protein